MNSTYTILHLNRLKVALGMLETTDIATLMGYAATRINRLTEETKIYRTSLEKLRDSHASPASKAYAKIVLKEVDKLTQI
jgi:hypothetical protein